MKHSAALGLLALLPSLATAAPLGSFSQVVFFGDSFTDGGAAFSLAPSEVPPEVYPNGQLTNGDVWATQLGGTYEDGTYIYNPLTNTFSFGTGLSTTNFAVGGAEAVAESDDRSPDLGTQIDAFRASGLDLGSNALGTILIGANDIGEATSEAEAIAEGLAVIGAIATGAKTLLQSGIEKVAVFGMPDLGIFPSVIASGLSDIATAYTPVFNSALQGAIDIVNLQLELAGLGSDRITYVDSFAIFDSILSDPGAFGITNTTDACFEEPSDLPACLAGDPNTFFFYDTVHPTEVVHTAFADTVRREFVPAVPLPASAGLLALGLAGLLVLRRRSSAG